MANFNKFHFSHHFTNEFGDQLRAKLEQAQARAYRARQGHPRGDGEFLIEGKSIPEFLEEFVDDSIVSAAIQNAIGRLKAGHSHSVVSMELSRVIAQERRRHASGEATTTFHEGPHEFEVASFATLKARKDWNIMHALAVQLGGVYFVHTGKKSPVKGAYTLQIPCEVVS